MKQNILGLKELRENMETYISQIEKGKSFLVVRKSKPVFRMAPIQDEGGEGQWETVIDFTKIRKGGVPADEILQALENLNEQDRKVS